MSATNSATGNCEFVQIQDGAGEMREETLPALSSQTSGNEAGRMLSSNDLSDAIRGIRDSVTKLSNELDILKRSQNRSNHPGNPTDSTERNFAQRETSRTFPGKRPRISRPEFPRTLFPA
jgi:hypothetical protein